MALSQDQANAGSDEGSLNSEMKTKDPQLGGLLAALGGWAFSPLCLAVRVDELPPQPPTLSCPRAGALHCCLPPHPQHLLWPMSSSSPSLLLRWAWASGFPPCEAGVSRLLLPKLSSNVCNCPQCFCGPGCPVSVVRPEQGRQA